MHIIDVMVRYNTENTSIFTWKGSKPSGYKREICQEYPKYPELTYVTDVWIRQRDSINTWIANYVLVQENPESPSYEKYVLNPQNLEFWTDG